MPEYKVMRCIREVATIEADSEEEALINAEAEWPDESDPLEDTYEVV